MKRIKITNVAYVTYKDKTFTVIPTIVIEKVDNTNTFVIGACWLFWGIGLELFCK